MYGTSPIEIMACSAMLNRQIYCFNFSYSAQWFGSTALGANGTQSIPTQITSDSDFVIQRMNLVSFSAAGTKTVDPDFTLLLTVAGTAVNLMDQAQPILNICGNFSLNYVPNDLPFPIVIPANNTLNSTLVNRTAVAQNLTQLTFTGFKVKYLTNSDGSPTSRQQVFNIL
jgi:hypothetical protein